MTEQESRDPSAGFTPVHNPGRSKCYVAGLSIAPGETRLIPNNQLPPGYALPAAPEPPPPPPPDPLAELLESNVASVVQALAHLTDSELRALRDLEAAGKERKGVLEGIDEQLLHNARRATELEDLQRQIDAALQIADDADLQMALATLLDTHDQEADALLLLRNGIETLAEGDARAALLDDVQEALDALGQSAADGDPAA